MIVPISCYGPRDFTRFKPRRPGSPGACRATLAQFDDQYDEVYADHPVADVPALDLVPRCSTALLDAIGKLVNTAAERIAKLPEDERPGSVIVGS